MVFSRQDAQDFLIRYGLYDMMNETTDDVSEFWELFEQSCTEQDRDDESKDTREMTDDTREKELGQVLSFVAGSMIQNHPKWDMLSASILQIFHERETPSGFVEAVKLLQSNRDVTGSSRPLLDEAFASWIISNAEWIDNMFMDEIKNKNNTFHLRLFGWKTLYKSYLMRSNGKIVERPEHLWFRVALFLHRDDHDAVVECFRDLRSGKYTHATPTLFYAGARRAQMASCFPWNTIVYTRHGGVPIGRIKQGVEVLTHTGEWKKVSQIHTDVVGSSRHMSRLRYTSHTKDLVVEATSDHPFLTRDNRWVHIGKLDNSRGDMLMRASSFFLKKSLVSDISPSLQRRVMEKLVVFTGDNQHRDTTILKDSETENILVHILDKKLQKALEKYETDERNGTHGRVFEWYLSEYAVETIPYLLKDLIQNMTTDERQDCRRRWQERNDPYVNMWYEQWMDLMTHDSQNITCTLEHDLPYKKEDVVYTLGVEDDHSYVVQGYVVKNCFLVGTEDSIEGIFKTLSDVAQISKWAGGLGIHISNIRSNKSYIAGTNGYSNGILPMIRLYNDTSRYIDQCFGGTTRVWTRTRGWIPFFDLTVGDEILTSKGVYKRVLRILTYTKPKNTEMYEIFHDNNNESVCVTRGHCVWCDAEDGVNDWDPVAHQGMCEYDLHTHTMTDDHHENHHHDNNNGGFCGRTSYMTEKKKRGVFRPLCDWGSGNTALIRTPPVIRSGHDVKFPHIWDRTWTRVFVHVINHRQKIRFVRPDVWEFVPDHIVEMCENELSWVVDVSHDEQKGYGLTWKTGYFPWSWDLKTNRPSVPYEWIQDVFWDKFIDQRQIFIELFDNDYGGFNKADVWRSFYQSVLWKHKMCMKNTPSRIERYEWRRVEPIVTTEPMIVFDLVIDGDDPSYTTEIGVVHNGGGKRNGAFAMYMEPWHADIFSFLHAKKNTGPEEERARDLFYGMWIPDLFMKRVQENKQWSLMCPKECPRLCETYGEEFERLYTRYEEEKKVKQTVWARELFTEMMRSQIETGTPYMMYKDTCNKMSNQKNLGTIRSSNLCVTGETMMLTREGYVNISMCVGETIHVWNGSDFIPVTPLLTNDECVDILEITFLSGKKISTTSDHVFYLSGRENTETVCASDLKENMVLCECVLPPVSKCSKAFHDTLLRVIHYVIQHCVRFEESFVVYSYDRTSLDEIQYDLELVGVRMNIRQVSSSSGVSRWMGLFSEHDKQILTRLSSLSWDVSSSIVSHGHKIEGETVARVVKRKTSCGVPVYCVREPFRHRVVFQGIMTGQCTEIIEYSDQNEYAVCNLASISLPSCLQNRSSSELPSRVCVVGEDPLPHEYEWVCSLMKKMNVVYTRQSSSSSDRGLVVNDGKVMLTPYDFFRQHLSPRFDMSELSRIVRRLVVNLNRVIDTNVYPTPETRYSNLRHRPIGIGVQGLADVFCRLKIPFDSPDARQLNQDMFETIYHTAVEASATLAQKDGAYSTFTGSPLSQGVFHWQLSDHKPVFPLRHDWDGLRRYIQECGGVRNSLMIAPMPTASTSQILNNNECFEPYTSNFYVRRTGAGEFMMYNKEMFHDIYAMKKWDYETRQELLWNRGSVSSLVWMPDWMKKIYRTVWEIPQRSLLDMAADRQFFIDQSQSMNLFLSEPHMETLAKMHLYGWKKGLKTGSYYIRSRPVVSTPHFTLDPHYGQKRTMMQKKTHDTTPLPPQQQQEQPKPVCPWRPRSKTQNKTTEDPSEEEEVECLMCSA